MTQPKKEKAAQVAVYVPLRQLFSYSFKPEDEAKLVPGVRVVAPFRNRENVGVFTGFTETDIELKEIKAVLDTAPIFNAHLMKLALWAADYYIAAPGELFRGIGPREELKKKVVYEKTAAQPGRLRENKKRILDALKERLGAQTLAAKCGLTVTELDKAAKSLVKSGLLQKREEYYLSGSELAAQEEEEAECEKIIDPATYTAEQNAAIEKIAHDIEMKNGAITLLEGKTGSGKTEVYIALCKKALAAGGGTILLVPEIALTFQFVRRFRARFPDDIAVLHSGLTPARRREEWRRISDGRARVVIGARSAIFAPMENLRLIVVDEEHDGSYKQSESPHYNARDLAVVLGGLTGAAVVLGSATPSLESYHNALNGKYALCRLTQRIDNRPMPAVRIVEEDEDGERLLPAAVIEKIMERMGRGEQSLVFINRRGAASRVKCRVCKEVVGCPNCSVSLTYHSNGAKLLCHYCGYQIPVPRICPACKAKELFTYRGTGTQKVEEFLHGVIPKAVIERLDQDTAPSREKAFGILDRFEKGETEVLVGTQMTAKGHDFANLTFTAIVSADDYLSFPDFRSAERTFGLVTQAAGRTGRGEKGGEVIISGATGHYAIRHAVQHDYQAFYADEILARKRAGYPPFSRLIGIMFDDINEERLKAAMLKLAREMPPLPPGVEPMGPVEALIYKIRNRYRWKMMLRGKGSKALHEAALRIEAAVDKNIGISIDVDPYGFL
ncbi:MAG: primosomal protein N' [Candidatus Nitrosotenuis sp.]|nr:MAG: primosomal protein N' [Candidatus Nitrosotenuis sp.]